LCLRGWGGMLLLGTGILNFSIPFIQKKYKSLPILVPEINKFKNINIFNIFLKVSLYFEFN
jgi:hypothetical protein